MKTLPGLFKISFKKNKMDFGGWYMFGLKKDLIFFCMCMKHPIAVFTKKLFFRIHG